MKTADSLPGVSAHGDYVFKEGIWTDVNFRTFQSNLTLRLFKLEAVKNLFKGMFLPISLYFLSHLNFMCLFVLLLWGLNLNPSQAFYTH